MVVTLRLGSGYSVFLPLINKVGYPDLVVDSVSVTGDAAVEIVIRNSGQAPVTSLFWVDLYIGLTDSSQPPTQLNDIWNNFSPHGGVWAVKADQLPIAVGQTVTLRVNDNSFNAGLSDIGALIGANTPLYVQVDSADISNPNGGVLENHEQNNGLYNNLIGPVTR
jgi:hypothetical protein